MERIIILVSGKAGAGKTTIANRIKEHLIKEGWGAKVTGFARQVKNCAIEFFGWDEKKDELGRKLLQSIGNTGREYDPNLWASWALVWIDENGYEIDGRTTEFIIFDDWRFANEFDRMASDDYFKVIKVRVESERSDIENPELRNDISEVSLPEGLNYYYDYILYNRGELSELLFLVDQMTDDILEDYRNEFNFTES